MKTYNKTCILIIILLGIIISCCKVHTYPSRAMMVNRSIDKTLKDSALIFGMVYSAEDENTSEETV